MSKMNSKHKRPFWVKHITEDEDDHICVRCCCDVAVDFDSEWLGPDDNYHFNVCNDCAQHLVVELWNMVKANDTLCREAGQKDAR